MWKFRNLTATLILREINFSDFRSNKIAIFIVFEALNFDFDGFFFQFLRAEFLPKTKFRASQPVKITVTGALEVSKIDFT